MSSYPRPTELTLEVVKEPVEGSCPECGAEQLMAYPVLGEVGWLQVVKCQSCLCSTSREPWTLLGPVDVLVNSL